VISVLIAIAEFIVDVFWYLWGGMRWIFFATKALLRSAFGHPKFAAIAQEFFTEAAVLVFVFPILDTIVQFGRQKVTLSLGLGSIGVAVLLLFVAGIIGGRIKDKT